MSTSLSVVSAGQKHWAGEKRWRLGQTPILDRGRCCCCHWGLHGFLGQSTLLPDMLFGPATIQGKNLSFDDFSILSKNQGQLASTTLFLHFMSFVLDIWGPKNTIFSAKASDLRSFCGKWFLGYLSIPVLWCNGLALLALNQAIRVRISVGPYMFLNTSIYWY